MPHREGEPDQTVIYPGMFIVIAYAMKVIPPGSGSETTTGTVKQTERRFEREDHYR